MRLAPLDQVTNALETAVLDLQDFEARFGKRAGVFLRGLPGLFRLYRRLPYAPEASPELRRTAAAVALYVAEHQDFLADTDRKVAGLIDDLWLVYSALPRFIEAMGEEALAPHWRGDLSFGDVAALAENASELAQHVPSKVLERLQHFLDDPRSCSTASS